MSEKLSFLSSKLTCSARDPQQTDLLIRKYFRKGDIYVHSDLPNSSVVIIKNPVENAVIPPGTIAQAGLMAVATSRAWEVKQGISIIIAARVSRQTLIIVTSSWWVPYAQIQRREGGYNVLGKKTFLPPAMLVLGYGILWTTEDKETMDRHSRPLLTDGTQGTAEEVPEAENVVSYIEEPIIAEVESDDTSDVQEIIPQEDKYNLDQYGSVSEDEGGENELNQSLTKQHLSAKQRRDLKKGKPIQGQSDAADPEVAGGASSPATLSAAKAKQAPQVRGKKGKKKQKARYADQSDEERELARKLLGAKYEASATPTEIARSSLSNNVDPVAPIKKPALPSIPNPMRPITDEPLEVVCCLM